MDTGNLDFNDLCNEYTQPFPAFDDNLTVDSDEAFHRYYSPEDLLELSTRSRLNYLAAIVNSVQSVRAAWAAMLPAAIDVYDDVEAQYWYIVASSRSKRGGSGALLCRTEDGYRITCSQNEGTGLDSLRSETANCTPSIHSRITYDGFVYDVSTDRGRFQAGVGGIIVHNTDSVFVRIDPAVIMEKYGPGSPTDTHHLTRSVYKWASEVAVKITKEIGRPPTSLSFEKLYQSLLLLRKKGYAAKTWVPTKRTGVDEYILKEDTKGLQMVKRDTLPLLSVMQKGLIAMFFQDKTVSEIKEYLERHIVDLWSGNTPLNLLTMSITYNGHYKNPIQYQKVLAEHYRDATGEMPAEGSRISYLLSGEKPVKIGKGGLPVKSVMRKCDLIMPTHVVIEAGLPLNYDYYFWHGIDMAMKEFLPFLGQEVFDHYMTLQQAWKNGTLPKRRHVPLEVFFGPIVAAAETNNEDSNDDSDEDSDEDGV